MKRVLLIDGDLYAYRVAAAEQKTSDWGDGEVIIFSDLEQGKANLDLALESLKESLWADEMLITLSSPRNFRYSIFPAYKSNRAEVERPEILEPLKQHLIDNYETKIKDGLEADDVMGIYLTNPFLYPGYEKVCVTMDKDLRTVPGLHYAPHREGAAEDREDQVPTLVTLEEADRFHLYQSLIGDQADGYPGCPGVGPVMANKILDELQGVLPKDRVLTRGPRKGLTITEWFPTTTNSRWEAIVQHFEKAGLTEQDAIVQAQLARILRYKDFNYKTQEPILWQPSLLS